MKGDPYLVKTYSRGAEIKSSISEVQVLNPSGHDWAMTKWRDFSKEGYSSNPTIFRCIDLVATNAASIRPRVKVGGEYVDTHPILDLLNRPNPMTGGQEFRIEAYSWALLSGNVFTERKVGQGRVMEMHNWQPYMFSIDRSSTNIQIPLRYWASKDSAGAKSWEVDPSTGASDMMHLALFNPKDGAGFMGLAPMEAAAMAGDQLNAASKWRYNSLKNDCRPSLAVILKNANPQQYKEARKEINKKSGYKSASDSLVVAGDTEIKPISMTAKDADWLGGTKLNKQEICEVFGVPGQLIGLEGSQTYANYSEARYAFYIQTVLPLVDLYFDELNRWLSQVYGDGVKICYDKSEIDALDHVRNDKVKTIIESKGIATLNEKRELLGLPPRTEPDADQVFTDPNMLPLGMDLFTPEEAAAGEAAKAFIKMGMDRQEAESKAMDMFNSCDHGSK